MSSKRSAMSSRVPQSAERVDSSQVKEAMARLGCDGEEIRFDLAIIGKILGFPRNVCATSLFLHAFLGAFSSVQPSQLIFADICVFIV